MPRLTTLTAVPALLWLLVVVRAHAGPRLRGGPTSACPDGAEAGCVASGGHRFIPESCACVEQVEETPAALLCTDDGAPGACAEPRLWPTVYLIGSGRCGSTSFSAMLKEHPDLLETQLVGDDDPWRAKELAYWGCPLGDCKDLSWYLAHFPVPAERLAEARAGALRAIDATPAYSSQFSAATQMKEAYPPEVADETRFLQVVRNPTDRFLSYYCRMVSGSESWSWLADAAKPLGINPTDESDLLRLVEMVIAAVSKCLEAGSGLKHMTVCAGWNGNNLFKVLADGLYLEQLEHWARSFPLEQLFLTTTNELKDDPKAMMHAAFDFAGLRTEGLGKRMSWEGAVGHSTRVNGDQHKCNRSTLDADAVAALDTFYAPHNMKLAAWLKGHQGVVAVRNAAIADVAGWASTSAPLVSVPAAVHTRHLTPPVAPYTGSMGRGAEIH